MTRDRSADRLQGRDLAPRARRTSSPAPSRSSPSPGTTPIRAARCWRAASRIGTRCARARTSSSIWTRFPTTCCAARGFSISTIRTIPRPPIAPREYLERVVARCRELDILLVYDNAYSELAFDGYVPPSIFEIDGARDVAIEFHSLSKTYNMTGWRCGWAVAAPEIASVLDEGQVVHRHRPVHGGAGGRRRGARELRRVRAGQRRDLQGAPRRRGRVRSATPASTCDVPRATMYLWIALPDGMPSALFADRLLEEEGVVVMPGSSASARAAKGSFASRSSRRRSASPKRRGAPVEVLTSAGSGGLMRATLHRPNRSANRRRSRSRSRRTSCSSR